MDPTVVIIITWTLAALVVGAYIWFVVWRFRVERRKKEAQAITDAAMSDAIAKTAAQMSPPLPSTPAPSTATTPSAMPASAPSPTPSPESPAATPAPATAAGDDHAGAAARETTVAGCLAGIALPNDLVPLTTIADRPAVGDRVAFWTDRAPAEIVGPAFATELERLGFTVITIDERTLSAQKAADRLLVVIHPDGDKAVIGDQRAFPSVPEQSVVIETWLPT